MNEQAPDGLIEGRVCSFQRDRLLIVRNGVSEAPLKVGCAACSKVIEAAGQGGGDSATSRAVTGLGKSLIEPSGRVMRGMGWVQRAK